MNDNQARDPNGPAPALMAPIVGLVTDDGYVIVGPGFPRPPGAPPRGLRLIPGGRDD